MAQEIRFRLSLDGAQQVQQGAAATGQALGQMGTAAAGAAKSTGQVGYQAAQVSAQLQDFFVQVQGGGNPITALIQQGSQLSAVFGGVGNAIKGVAALVTPAVAVIGTLAGGIGALALAYRQGSSEADAYAKSLILTGNAAGSTVGQLNAMAKAISANVGTQGKAAENLAQLAGSGKVAASELQKLAEASIRFERAGGAAADETNKKFVELGRAPLQGLLKLNEAEGFLTATLYRQIKALEDQGRTSEAAAKAQEGYAQVVLDRTAQIEQRLGTLPRVWRSVADAAKGAWDAMAGAGRPDTLEENIEAAQRRIATIQRTIQIDQANGRQPSKKDAADLAREQAYVETQREGLKLDRQIAEAKAGQVAQGRYLAEAGKAMDAALSNQLKLEKEIAQTRLAMEVAGKSDSEIEKVIAYQRATSAAGQESFAAAISRINLGVAQVAGRLSTAQQELDSLALRGLVSQRAYIEQSGAIAEEGLRKEIAALEEARARTAAQARSSGRSVEAAVGPFDIQLLQKTTELLNRRLQLSRELVPVQLQEAAAVVDVAQAFRQSEIAERNASDDKFRQARVEMALAITRQSQALDDSIALQTRETQLMFATDTQRAVTLEQLRIELALKRQLKDIDALTFANKTDGEGNVVITGAQQKQDMIDKATAEAARAKAAAVGKIYADELKKTSDQISQGLTDAILNGLHAGRDGVRTFVQDVERMFEQMVLRPTIQAFLQPIAGAALSALGVGGGQGAGGANWLSALGSGASIYKTGGGWFGGGASAAGGVGGATEGWTASQLGTGTAAAEGSAAAGSAAGSSAASAIPIIGWIIAGILASRQAYNAGNNMSMLRSGDAKQYGIGLWEEKNLGVLKSLGFSDKWAEILSGAPLTARLFGQKASVSGFGFGSVQGGDFIQSTASPIEFGRNTLKGGAASGLQDFAAQIAAAIGLAAGRFGGGLTEGLRVGTFTDTDRTGKVSSLLGLFGVNNKLVAGTQTGSGAFGAGGPGVAASKIDQKDLQQWFNDQMPVLILQGLQQSTLDKRFEDYFDAVGQASGLTAEKAQQILTVAGSVQQLTEAFTPLGGVFKQFGAISVETFKTFADSLGGFDQFGQQVGTFFNTFASTSEKTQSATKQVTDALAGVGLTMPDVAQGADKAHAAFKALVDAQDITTESGRKAFAALIGVSGAFDQLVQSSDAAAAALQSSIDQALPKFLSGQQLEQFKYGQVSRDLSKVGVNVSVEQLMGATKDQILEFAKAFVTVGDASMEAKIAVVDAAGALADLKGAAQDLAGGGFTINGKTVGNIAGGSPASELQAFQVAINGGRFDQYFQRFAPLLGVTGLGLTDAQTDAYRNNTDLGLSTEQTVALRGVIPGPTLGALFNWFEAHKTPQYQPIDDSQAAAGRQALEAAQQRAQDENTRQLEQLTQGLKDARQSLQSFTDSLMAGPLSALSPEQQYANASAQFETAIALARAGSKDGERAAEDAARTFLEVSKSFGGAPIFGRDSERVLQALNELKALLDRLNKATEDGNAANVNGLLQIVDTTSATADSTGRIARASTAASIQGAINGR